MASLIDMLTGKKAKSADQAKERLKFVLIHDRTDLTDDSLGRMKDEIIQVISRYIEIDESSVQISVAQDGREQRLVADIPLKAARRRKAR
ncbi:MAG TPA: cell division topological specificity factor MinE [Anaerolineaceae bacterium]|nr:cell division topological specificity factor MinE [Anaerolineaceae bacterium]